MEHGFVAWFLDRCRENFRLVKEAPEAFVILAILVGLLVYIGLEQLHGERFTVLNDRIASLNEQVSNYRTKLSGATPDEAAKRIDALKDQISDLKTQMGVLSRPRHNNTTLYKNDIAVATVRTFQAEPTKNAILFPIVTATNELDMTTPFEFMDWSLQCDGQPTGAMSFGAMQQINYPNVTCRIRAK